jgi:hypothetical protein
MAVSIPFRQERDDVGESLPLAVPFESKWRPRASVTLCLSSFARRDCHDHKPGSGVGDVGRLVVVQRSSEPAAGFALIRSRLLDAPLDRLIIRSGPARRGTYTHTPLV